MKYLNKNKASKLEGIYQEMLVKNDEPRYKIGIIKLDSNIFNIIFLSVDGPLLDVEINGITIDCNKIWNKGDLKGHMLLGNEIEGVCTVLSRNKTEQLLGEFNITKDGIIIKLKNEVPSNYIKIFPPVAKPAVAMVPRPSLYLPKSSFKIPVEIEWGIFHFVQGNNEAEAQYRRHYKSKNQLKLWLNLYFGELLATNSSKLSYLKDKEVMQQQVRDSIEDMRRNGTGEAMRRKWSEIFHQSQAVETKVNALSEAMTNIENW